MRTLLSTEFLALLAYADVSQARFARLAGITARPVNNWCRGRATVPRWAAILAIALQELTAESLETTLEEANCRRHEGLGTPATRPTMNTAALAERAPKDEPDAQIASSIAAREAPDSGPAGETL